MLPRKPNKGRQNGDEDPGIDAVKEHLKHTIKGDQAGGVFVVAPGQLVPHDYHGNAARQSYHNEANHIFGTVGEENNGQDKHQDWSNNPILDQGKTEYLPVPKYFAQLFIPDLCQGRVHHEDQANRYRKIRRSHLKPINESLDTDIGIAKRDTKCHCRKDPKSEEAIQE
jgi:hypothetical protein